MGNWQDSAKQSIINRTSGGTNFNTPTVGTKSSGSWQQQAKQSLDSRGYVTPENRMYEIKTNSGRNFGTVSYGAYKAIQNNTLDKYSPKNDDEKNVINAFKAYLNEQIKAQEKAEKQKRINSNPVTKKYGIDPDSFTQADFKKWAEEHGFEYRMGGNDLTGAEMKWMPKQKKSWKFWEVVPSKEEQSDKKTLETLAENNSRRAASQTDKGAVAAAVVGAIDGLTFGAANAYADWNAKRDYKKAGFDEDSFVSYKQAGAKTENEHKIASAAGNIAGSLVSLGGLSKAVGAAASGVKWIAKAPGWVQSAINSGITFAVQSGANTAFDGGNFEDVLKSAGINLIGGAVGGGVSGKVGSIGEKLLFDKGLQHKVIPEMIRTGVSSAAFAGSKTASTYFLYPEDYRPTKEEMAKDVTTAFAFGAISSGINTIKTSSQNKKYLDGLYQKMAADYESMAKANISGKNDTAGIQKFAKNVVGYSNAMEAYLTGKEYNATINGETYTFTPNKIRLVGQDKYVKSILGELDTIRNNANAVLNGIGTPTTDIAVTSAPANNATPVAAAPTSKNTASTENTPAPAASDTIVAASVAAAETAAPQSAAAVNTSVPDTNMKSNTGGELGEIMSSEPIITFTPETASSEIKRLENILIAKGADDTSRKEIIDTAVEIEKTLDGSDKNMRSVFNDISKITSTAINEIQNQAGLTGAYWKLFGENFKSVSTGNVKENAKLVTEYSNAYAQALKNNNPEKYNSVMLSSDGQDLSVDLPKTIMQNTIPNNVQNAGQYRLIAAQIKNIINAADVQLESERIEIYGKNASGSVENNAEAAETQTITKPKNITLTRMGDFYEAFGNEALELAEKLNLTPTTKSVNGESVQMVGFPVSSLGNYKNVLGSGYNISVSDTSSVTGVEAQNMTVNAAQGQEQDNTTILGDAGAAAKQETTRKQTAPKLTTAKKGDWASHDVYWYAPGSKTVVAYSTKAASDLIEAFAQDYPRAAISEIQAAIPYDAEAKKVLQAYIDNGYGNEIASEHFKDVQRSAASSLTQPVGNDIMKVNQTKEVERDGQSRERSQKTGIKQTNILGLRGHDGRGYNRAGSERLRLYLGRGNRKDNSGSLEGVGGNRQEDRRYFRESAGERNQLIVNSGKSLANYTQIPETLYTDEMRSIAENNNQYGIDTIFTVGDITFQNFDDTTRKVPATVVGRKIFINANLDAALSDVSDHEMVHYAIRKLAAETNQDTLNIARNLMTSVRSYMKPESFREVFGISTQLVRANYQKITKFNLLDEFCAEMGYLVRYHETSDWFSDYEGAVRLFNNLLTLEPQKQAWLQEVGENGPNVAYIKKAPAQQAENVQAFSSNVRNDSADTEVSDADVGSQVPNADNSPQPTFKTPLVSSSEQ